MSHADLLSRLLPSSYDASGRVLNAQLQSEANALDAAQRWADSLLVEDDPRTALQLITRWERALGASANTDTAARRTYLVGKLNELGGQNRQYFIDLARSMGFVVTIDEFRPASIMADVMTPFYTSEWSFVWRIRSVNGYAIATVLSGVDSPIYGDAWVFNNHYRQSTVMDTLMDPFASWGNADFESTLREDAPAHTLLLFSY